VKRENKIIRCRCGQEITIPAELDEDYGKNDDPCCLDGAEFPNGAVTNPWYVDFAYKECFQEAVDRERDVEDEW
jgi:hypothetical protein